MNGLLRLIQMHRFNGSVGTTAERATVGDRVAAAELRFLGGINTPSEAVDLSGSATERGDDIVGG